MSQLILDQNLERKEDSEEEDPSDQENINKINNYKGIFGNEESEEEQRYFEYGSHFPYNWMCERLEELSLAFAHGNNSLYETMIKNERDTANDKGINKEVNFRRISTKDTKQSAGNERINGKKNNPGINYSNINNQGNNFNKRFLFPKETVNKIPSVSLLNNASMSNIMENNILSLLNDNLNNNHKSRNVNKVDNVYNNGTVVAVHEAPIRILNKGNEYENSGDNNSVLLKNNLKEFSKLKADPNKHVTSTFKKEDKKSVDNFHVYTSYSNAVQKNETGYKPLLAKKNGNQFLNNKIFDNTQNNPIVLVEKKIEENKTKYNYDNFFNSKNPKKINSISKDKNSSSPNKDNNIMNKYINKLNNYKKSTDSSKVNIIIAVSSKMGRNVNKNKLNPHNTNVSQTKTPQTAALNKIKAENPQLSKFKQEIKKLNLEKIFRINDRQSATASVDNRNFPSVNLLTRNKNKLQDQLSLSPGNIKVDTNRPSKVEKDTITISRDELKVEILNNSVEESDKIKSKIGLTEIMSNLTRNNETKSRNAQRSQIAITSSNLFSSDKAQSMQNVSYQKTDILSTQINKKNITLMKPHVSNCIARQKPKTITVVNKSFTSHMNLKTKKQDVFNNCTTKKKVNNITIWSVAENKKIQIKFGTTNTTINTNKNEVLNSKEKENKLEIKNENVLGMKITNTKINWKPSPKAEVQSPMQKKITNALITVNTNSKNKSNSLNTNLDIGKGIGMSLIKNYKLNNNPTKISYNSKKSDSTASKSIYGSYSSNKNSLGLINILSTKSNKL